MNIIMNANIIKLCWMYVGKFINSPASGKVKQTVIVCAEHRDRVQVWVAFSNIELILF